MATEGAGEVIVPTSPADKAEIKANINEIMGCMQRIDDEKSAMKDIIDAIKEKFNIPPEHTRNLAKTHYKRNFTEVTGKNEDFELLYETFFGPDE